MLLEVNNLNIEFYDHDLPERVVNDLNMKLDEGEILGIVGESGSGKSMTAMAIAGLLKRHDMKTEGEILFEGEELLHAKRDTLRQYQGNEISIVFQEPMTSLNPVKRIGWQVEESLRLTDHGSCNHNTLSHASGKLMWIFFVYKLRLIQFHIPQSLNCASISLTAIQIRSVYPKALLHLPSNSFHRI